MKPMALLTLALWMSACSSSGHERPSTLDERQEHIQAQRPDTQRASAHDYGTTPTVPGATNDLDDDRDAIADHERDGTAESVDERAQALTPTDQSNTSSDIEITQAIRKKVMSDDDLSFNAKNVKIITVAGKVTLRGPVESSQESAQIERSAQAVPGVATVVNQLEVRK